MASPTVSVEIKMSDEFKALCDRIPDNMTARLAEIERVLVEVCDREGIAFNLEDQPQPKSEPERVLRNVKDGVLQDGSMPERMR